MPPALVAGALLVAAGGGAPQGAAGQQVGTCRITAVDASVSTERNAEGVVVYFGNVFMETAGCGISPAQVEGTFTPVAGEASTCNFQGTLFSDDAVCTAAVAAAAIGTPMTIAATGRTGGQGGAQNFASSCVVIVPSLGRTSCALPIR